MLAALRANQAGRSAVSAGAAASKRDRFTYLTAAAYAYVFCMRDELVADQRYFCVPYAALATQGFTILF